MSVYGGSTKTHIERMAGDRLRYAVNRAFSYDGVRYEPGDLLPAGVDGHKAEVLARTGFVNRVLPVASGNLREAPPSAGDPGPRAAGEADAGEERPPTPPDSRQPEPGDAAEDEDEEPAPRQRARRGR
ncbi:MAG TPA: hypothetical protein VFL91_15275 [Thermomicrobiales bacterium]|nr:hypothetical protein [Thermomicrobiales bacterium]